MAEMLEGKESLQMYKKGIDVLSGDVQRYETALRKNDAILAKR